MRCHACGAAEEVDPVEGVSFRAVCDACSSDLHVCRNCQLHDEGAYNGCREADAERVVDPTRANRCEYFRPRGGDEGGAKAPEQRSDALSALEALFKK